MRLWQLTLLSVFITTPVLASVKAYFNHNPRTSYAEPYRNVTRSGDNLEQVLINEINLAKKTIFVAVQELRLPLVAKALINKMKAGVDVRVILEHDYNFNALYQRQSAEDEYEATKLTELKALVDINRDGKLSKSELESRDAVYMLALAKVPVMDDTFDNSAGSGLMHHKFMIVDGKTTVVSSANFTLSCIHGDILSPASRGNANSMVVVKGAAVANLFEEEFLQMWGNGKRGNFGHSKTYRGPVSAKVNGIKITVQFSPTSRRYNWEETANGLMAQNLAKATKSINAALFVFSDQNISNMMEKRSNAGVKTGVLVERKFAFRDYSELLDMAGLAMLNPKCTYEADNKPWNKPSAEIGVPSLNAGDVLHHKFGVVDNRIVIMGSENWSDAANYVNDETVMVIESPGISEQYTQEYKRLKNLSRMGVPATIKQEISRLQRACVGKGIYF